MAVLSPVSPERLLLPCPQPSEPTASSLSPSTLRRLSREAVVGLLLDAGAAVDVWGHDLTGPLDLLAAREAQIQAQMQAEHEATRLCEQSTGQSARPTPLGASPHTGRASLGGHGSTLSPVQLLAEVNRNGGPMLTSPSDLGVMIRQKSGRNFGGAEASPELPPL